MAKHRPFQRQVTMPKRAVALPVLGVAALCGAATTVALLDLTNAPDAGAVPGPFPATIEPIPPTTSSDTLLLPYFETDLNAPPPVEAPPPTQGPPPNGIPFLPPLPTISIPTLFPFPPG